MVSGLLHNHALLLTMPGAHLFAAFALGARFARMVNSAIRTSSSWTYLVPTHERGARLQRIDTATEGSTTTEGSSTDDSSPSTAEPTDGTSTDEPTTSPADGESSTTGSEAACGDGIVQAFEDCDGADLGGATCESLGLAGGTLACGPDCAYDYGTCIAPPEAPTLTLGFSAIKQFDFGWAAVEGADYYQLEESLRPGEPFVQLGEDIVGESISITTPLHLRNRASYRLRACNASGCTSSEEVDVMSSLVEAIGYFKASNTYMVDHFGGDLALSSDGSTLANGAPDEDSGATGIDGNQNDDSAPDAGAVYVFVRDARGQWTQQAYVKASNTDSDDGFGGGVALSADGSTLAVGASGESSDADGVGGDQADDSAPDAGATYVFMRDAGGQWSQQAYIKASNSQAGDAFGPNVVLSSDGNTLAVTALDEDSNADGIDGDQANESADGADAAYVFVRDAGGQWSQQAYIKASNSDPDDWFGVGLAISDDGDTMVVGAAFEDSNATGLRARARCDAAVVTPGVRQGVEHRRGQLLRRGRGALGGRQYPGRECHVRGAMRPASVETKPTTPRTALAPCTSTERRAATGREPSRPHPQRTAPLAEQRSSAVSSPSSALTRAFRSARTCATGCMLSSSSS